MATSIRVGSDCGRRYPLPLEGLQPGLRRRRVGRPRDAPGAGHGLVGPDSRPQPRHFEAPLPVAPTIRRRLPAQTRLGQQQRIGGNAPPCPKDASPWPPSRATRGFDLDPNRPDPRPGRFAFHLHRLREPFLMGVRKDPGFRDQGQHPRPVPDRFKARRCRGNRAPRTPSDSVHPAPRSGPVIGRPVSFGRPTTTQPAMNALITTGPSWEPLDGIRRLTNAKSGRRDTVLGTACGARSGSSAMAVQVDGGAR